jgi:hypothetical protein
VPHEGQAAVEPDEAEGDVMRVKIVRRRSVCIAIASIYYELKNTCPVLSAEQHLATGLHAIFPKTSPQPKAAPLTAPGR